MRFLALVLVLISFYPSFSIGPMFRAKGDDLLVDDRCEEYLPKYFKQEEVTFFTVSTNGTKRAGFDEEIKIDRNDARLLWNILYPNSKEGTKKNAFDKIKNNSSLLKYLEILEKGIETHEATYYSEGEVLEVLSYNLLPESDTFLEMLAKHFKGQRFSREDYFITGGVTYYSDSGQTIGELDVIVGDATTCSIFAIGEAKLGGRHTKARRQLDRIDNFIRSID